eukprot:TRINITY_DN1530_c0_g1_i1.p1 TRINITY_DN1530_c0_g1~~TRINITY_DN1530_c0_g1_i1.p1  ORF type:complete len:481 (-),score=180.72 TRINITY_DN1530_c0_g1_i1:200-1642(-)
MACTLLLLALFSLAALYPEHAYLLLWEGGKYGVAPPVRYRSASGLPLVHEHFYRPDAAAQRRHLHEAVHWLKVLESGLTGHADISSAPSSIDELYYQDCRADKRFLRMYADPMCAMLWLKKLAHEPIERISDLLAVITKKEMEEGMAGEKPTQNGGFKAYFSDGSTTGYWKPCYGTTDTSESYKGEVMGSILDKLAAFYRTPSVAAVYYSRERLLELADAIKHDPEARWKMETILEHCDDLKGEGAEGAMVGWSPFPVTRFHGALKTKTSMVDFRKLSDEEVEELRGGAFNISKESPFEARRFVFESSAVYLVNLLGGYMAKMDHNVYMMTRREGRAVVKGPFVYIDNDRSSWRDKTTMERWRVHKDGPYCSLCKFPRRVVDRLYTLRSPDNIDAGYTLGGLMVQAANRLYPHLPNGELFGSHNATWLDKNVDWVLSCVDRCVAQYGASNVFVEDPYYEGADEFDFYETFAAIERGRADV